MRRIVLAGLVAASPLATADSNHYNNMLIGDRASGMAGAYTSISDDPSGLYYNPAGIVYAGARNFSASVNAYHVSSTRYKNAIDGHEWERTASSLLPNFFGVIRPLGKGVVGFSYAVTDSIIEDQDSHFTGTSQGDFYININHRDVTNKFGPSYAYAISDKLSIGATLYAHTRNYKLIANQLTQDTTLGTYSLVNGYQEAAEFGLEPVVGVMWSPADKVSLGLSVRKTTITSSSAGSQTITSTDAATIATVDSASDDSKRELPTETRVGIAYFPSNRLLLSADFMHYGATQASGDAYLAKQAVTNLALGMEYYPSSSWAIRAGLYTNRSNTPSLDAANTTTQEDHIDMTGITLSLTRLTRTASITGGIGYSRGSGEWQNEAAMPIKSVDADSLTAYLSSSYSY